MKRKRVLRFSFRGNFMKNMIKIPTWVFVGVLLFGVIGFVGVILRHPSKLMLCDARSGDCAVFARFKKYEDCEALRERWAWYCDQSDKQKIECREGASDLSRTYCVE